MRVLTVDDSATMRRIIKNQLNQCGVEEIDEAANGREALMLLDRRQYDLPITDWNMPAIVGLDETEARVADGHTAARLLADVRRTAGAAGVPAVAEPVHEIGVLIERANGRAMEIMSALEFQDLTAQKFQRTFAVLEEVLVRL